VGAHAAEHGRCADAGGQVSEGGGYANAASPDGAPVRVAEVSDARAAAELLEAFNREYDDPSPGPDELALRLAELIASEETVVIFVGSGPDGLAVLRFRPGLWSPGLECYLAELYITPAQRGRGLGRTLMNAVLAEARRRGADFMEISVDESDAPARELYASLGFNNCTADGDLMFYYEREL
jgi:ribosomal protein S18 acetylase RimI-like enzyme